MLRALLAGLPTLLLLLLLLLLLDSSRAEGEPKLNPRLLGERRLLRFGQTAKLPCPVVSSPTLMYEWLQGNDLIDAGFERYRVTATGYLRIKNVLAEDSSVYTCRATNGFGSVSAEVKLYVTGENDSSTPAWFARQQNPTAPPGGFPPRERKPDGMLVYPSNLTLTAKQSATFECHVRSDATPSLRWLKRVDDGLYGAGQNVIIFNGGRYVVLETDPMWREGGDVFISKLRLPEVTRLDAGAYTCMAANPSGYVHRTAHLRVSDGYAGGIGQSSSLPYIIAVPAAILALILLITVVVVARKRCCPSADRHANTSSASTGTKSTSSSDQQQYTKSAPLLSQQQLLLHQQQLVAQQHQQMAQQPFHHQQNAPQPFGRVQHPPPAAFQAAYNHLATAPSRDHVQTFEVHSESSGGTRNAYAAPAAVPLLHHQHQPPLRQQYPSC